MRKIDALSRVNIRLALIRVINNIKRIIQDCESSDNVLQEIRDYLDMASVYVAFWDYHTFEVLEDGTCVALLYLYGCDQPITLTISGVIGNPGPEFVDWVKEGF